MYRKSLLGLALSCALDELAENHPSLSEDQKEIIWKTFDNTMENCLRETPTVTKVEVKQPTVVLDSEEPVGPTSSGEADKDSEDSVAFPVYQSVDGRWTILLKDPVLNVRDEYGAEETLKLDYLKVRVTDSFFAEKAKQKAEKASKKRPR